MQQIYFAVVLAVSLFASSSVVIASGNGHEGHAFSIGSPGDTTKISRTVAIDMNDSMRFVPSTISVKRGETIRFLVKNSGRIQHEMVFGSAQALKEHAAMMAHSPHMSHDEPNQVTVAPGKSGELIWQFNQTGEIDFACLEPGHFEAGMAGKVAVR